MENVLVVLVLLSVTFNERPVVHMEFKVDASKQSCLDIVKLLQSPTAVKGQQGINVKFDIQCLVSGEPPTVRNGDPT
jgi:hypothetical protein